MSIAPSQRSAVVHFYTPRAPTAFEGSVGLRFDFVNGRVALALRAVSCSVSVCPEVCT